MNEPPNKPENPSVLNSWVPPADGSELQIVCRIVVRDGNDEQIQVCFAGSVMRPDSPETVPGFLFCIERYLRTIDLQLRGQASGILRKRFPKMKPQIAGGEDDAAVPPTEAGVDPELVKLLRPQLKGKRETVVSAADAQGKELVRQSGAADAGEFGYRADLGE